MTTIILLVIVLFIAHRVTTAESRRRHLQAVTDVLQRLKEEARKAETRSSGQCQPFRDALRARTRWAFVTPTLIALNVVIFVRMHAGAGMIDDPKTLVSWGADFAPLTTNGEWWRLVTATFLHTRLLTLLVNIVGLLQVGLLLERLLGPLPVAAVYLTSGAMVNLANLTAYPLATRTGASGAILGLYGLLLATRMWSVEHRSSVTIPFVAVKRLSPAAMLFILFSLPNDGFTFKADLVGFVTGFVGGLLLARGVSEYKVPARRVAATMAAAVLVAGVSAFIQRGITDARPEIDRVVAVESQTAGLYQSAADRFRNGRITAENLIQVIERTIMPELQAADARLRKLDRVPEEQQHLITDAEEYLRLRNESWRLRAEGLRKANPPVVRGRGKADVKGKDGRAKDAKTKDVNSKTDSLTDPNWRLQAEKQYRSNMVLLGNAEGTERASLEVLKRIKPSDQK